MVCYEQVSLESEPFTRSKFFIVDSNWIDHDAYSLSATPAPAIIRKLEGKEMWVGFIELQMTFWGPDKKVQGFVIWFVL